MRDNVFICATSLVGNNWYANFTEAWSTAIAEDQFMLGYFSGPRTHTYLGGRSAL